MDFFILSLVPIVSFWICFAIQYFSERGINIMDSFLAACVTAAATLITEGFALFKNRQAEKYEHENLRKDCADMSEKLSKEHDNLHDVLNKEHEELSKEHNNLNNSLIQSHAEVMANLKDVRDYTIRTEAARDEAYRNGIDIKNVMAQIQALAEANADSTMRLKELQKDLDNCKGTIDLQSRIIEDKDEQLNQLRKENKLLQKQIYSFNAQNHVGRDEEEFVL